MDWHYWAAVGAGLVLASLADWLFAGVLFHEKYQAHPEVWRVNGPNPRAIVIAQVLTVPTVVGLITLIQMTASTALVPALGVAALVWLVAAAPATVVNGVFIKIHPAVVAAHTIGWLAKLALIAAAASVLLSM